MKKRMLALVMTLVMVVNCLGGITAFAVNATEYGDCDDHSGWIALNQNNISSYTYLSGGFYYFYSNGGYGGNFYLTSDLNMDVTLYVASNSTVNLCLNGHDISINVDRTVLNLKTNAVLNLYDCDDTERYCVLNSDNIAVIYDTAPAEYDFTIQGGAITGGVANAVGGGGVFIQQNAEFNMYGGNIVGNQCTAEDDRQGGGVYNYCGTFNLYGGSIQGNACNKTIAGGVYNRSGSTFNMYGGTIAYNYSATYGGGVYNVGEFNMSGGTIEYNTAAIGGGGISTAGASSSPDTTGIVNLSGTASISNNTGAWRCGGVYIAEYGSLNMSGGSITGNHSGGGGEAGVGIVYSSSALNMSGGTISGNTTTGASAGVGYTNGTFAVSESAVIDENYIVTIASGVKTNLAEANTYLANGNVITVGENFTGTVGTGVGVTLATGTGTVATGASTVNGFTSDIEGYYLVLDGSTVTIQTAVDTTGTDKTVTYSTNPHSVSSMFSATTSDTEYSIIGGTGSGTLDGTNLTVDKIGTFIIEADTPYSSTNPPTVETATLTVEPATVNISDITTTGNVTTHTADLENDGVIVTAHVAELNNTSGAISGVVNDDDVSIDFSVAYGLIIDGQGYDEDTVEDEDDFYVTLHDISITGDDAGNYVLGTVANTTVTINVATPYISWPTAKDITYGDIRSDDDLIGGQIMVKYGGEYFDITDKGSFVWATDEEDASYNVAIDAAGTHTYTVQFEFNDDITPSTGNDWDGAAYDETAYAKYVAAAEAATHNVTQLVNAKEVTFTITNNVQSTDSTGDELVITASDGLSVEEGDYWIYFTNSAGNWVSSNWTESHTTPVEAGTYLIAADFTQNSSVTSNYIHAGTMDATAKQIGAYVVYDVEDVENAVMEPTYYTVTFEDENGDDIDDVAEISAIEEEIHILPSLDTSLYSGWSYNGSIYEFGSRFPQPNSSVTFTAVPISDTAAISGTISGNTMKGVAGELSGIVVTLIQGPDQIATYVTGSDSEKDAGYYEFTVPQGRYDLVVTRDYIIRNEETIYVELGSEGVSGVDVTLPDTRQNTIFNVASGMTAITVEGMKDLMEGGEIRSIKLDLTTATTADAASILAEAAKEGLTTDNAKLFYNVSIQERGEDAANYAEITSLKDNETDSDDDKYLTLYIPLAGIYQGYTDYVVYRDDGDSVDILAEGEGSGEYMTVSGDLLTLHIQTSGIYGLAFYFNDATALSATDIEMEYTSATISTETMFANIRAVGTPTYVITSDDGGEATIDSSGNVTIIKVGTFTITAKVSDSASKSGYVSTGTLTVEPAEVTITGVTSIDRGVGDGSLYVDINAGGRISGVEDGDQVYIDFSSGYGLITDSDFADDETLNETGENIFDVAVMSLSLTGADADNYTLVGDVTSKVMVNMSIPHIAWPAATSVVFGNSNSHDDLYGGKVVVYETVDMELDEYGEEVVVYEGGTYTDITSYGEFQWVQLTTEANAGTYEYEVKFVEDTNASTYDGEASYRTTLDTTTHMVTQVVEPAAVTFAIADTTLDSANSETPVVTATDENGNVLDASLYKLYYATDDVWDWTGDEADFTVSGTYLIGAELLSANYHHAGTTVITAKQIGAVEVYDSGIGEEEPTTYTTTFKIDDVVYNVFEGALEDTIHVLPDLNAELDTDSYTGWMNDATGTIYDFSARVTQGIGDVSFTAVVAADKSATISGTITGEDVGTGLDVALSGVGVALYQGNTLIGTYTTGADGTYTFAVAPGVYNMVVTRTYNGVEYEITVFVDVTAGDSERDFELSNLVQNAILQVDKGMPEMAVEGLTALATSMGGTDNIEVKMTVSTSTQSDLTLIAEIQEFAAENGLTSNDIKNFFNIDLSYTDDDNTTPVTITQVDNCLNFYIPLTGDYQGHDEYYVYRYHNGEVQELTTESVDGEYFTLTADYLIISAKYFSLYGVGFIDYSVDTSTPSTSTASTYSSSVSATTNGDASLSSSKSTMNTKVTITTDPDDGYEVGSVTVTYASGKTVTVTDNGDGTYSYLQPGAAVTVTVTFVETDGSSSGSSSSDADDSWFFTDVDEDDWYYDAIKWAVEAGITTGKTTTTFDPYGITNRAQAVTFLWRSVGEPDYTAANEFSDVAVGAYYYDSVLWAGEHDITLGTTTTTFSPYMDCSRAHIITFLWRLAGKPVVGGENPFTDVSTNNYYYNAVLWAVSEGITQGTTDTTFSPDADCTRAQIVTFLYRSLEG